MSRDSCLICYNCGKKFPITLAQEHLLRAHSQALTDIMGELGIPRWTECSNPLFYLDANATCCLKPDIHW